MEEAGVTSVEDNHPLAAAMPTSHELLQNYPNPFNPSAQIRYTVQSAGHVSLSVYDLLGHKVTCLVDDNQHAGVHNVEFNAAELPSGVYFYKLETGNQSFTRKMMLIK